MTAALIVIGILLATLAGILLDLVLRPLDQPPSCYRQGGCKNTRVCGAEQIFRSPR